MSRILLGVTGGIAAYKACELMRLLVKAGHEVIPLLTRGAQRFVTEETFLALARRPRNDDVYEHLTRADLLVIAPCTANTLAKLANGIADNVLTEASLAHRGLRHSGNAVSPAHRRNLPATCGQCHTGPFVSFQKSQHFALLRRGDSRVPTCTTCHDAVASELPSPKVLEAECQRCHGPKGPAPRVERAASARILPRSTLELASSSVCPISQRSRSLCGSSTWNCSASTLGP